MWRQDWTIKSINVLQQNKKKLFNRFLKNIFCKKTQIKSDTLSAAWCQNCGKIKNKNHIAIKFSHQDVTMVNQQDRLISENFANDSFNC